MDEEQRKKERLVNAIASLEAARSNRSDDPESLIRCLIELALAVRSMGEKEQANALLHEAFVVFTTETPINNTAHKRHLKIQVRHLWRYLHEVADGDYETKVASLLRASELYAPRESDKLFLDALRLSRYADRSQRRVMTREDEKVERKKLTKLALDVKTAIRGENDLSLSVLTARSAQILENELDLVEAERLLMRVCTLYENQRDELKVSPQLKLASFYIRHQMTAKADEAIATALGFCADNMRKDAASSFHRFVTELQFLKKFEEAESIVDKLLEISGDAFVAEFDSLLYDWVSEYTMTGAFAKAEALLNRRVIASDKCSFDAHAVDFQLKLSEVLLTQGNDERSNQLFEHVRNSVESIQGPVDAITERRVLLLERLEKRSQAEELRKQLPLLPTEGPITLLFGLWAVQEMQFGHNTMINSYDSTCGKMVPSYLHGDISSICCLGQIIGDFSYGGTIVVPAPHTMQRPRFRQGQQRSLEDAPKEARHILPALDIPTDAIRYPLTSTARFRRHRPGARVPPGDYVASDLRSEMSSTLRSGRTRVFLSDEEDAPLVIRACFYFDSRKSPLQFQVWYGGTRKIRVSNMVGVLYAPNATVEIPFNGSFKGAIVANRIVGEGNNTYTIDMSLIGQIFAT